MNRKNPIPSSFESDLYELSDTDLDNVAGGAAQDGTQRTPGLNCPKCNSFIPVTIYDLINCTSIRCPACSLRLDIDHQKIDLS